MAGGPTLPSGYNIVSLQCYENIHSNMYTCTLCMKNITGLMAADISANASNIRKINQITLRAVITRPHLDDLAGGDGRRFIRLDALSAHF